MTTAQEEAPIRVAVVGLGWAGRTIWLPRLHEHPAFEVVTLVEPEAVLRTSVAEEANGPAVYATVTELPTDSVDLAVVAVPNHLHAPVASQLLGTGVPVFLEKPLCLSSAEVDQLAAAEFAGGSVLLGGSAVPFRADVRALRGLADSLGEIRHVELSWSRARGVPNAAGWFTNRRLAGGGALIDLGWHLLDTARFLLGPVVFERVVGTVSADFVNSRSFQAVWRYDAPAKATAAGDVEDTAHGFLVSAEGISVALQASWASHEAADTTMLRIEGSAGTAVLRCTFGFSPNRQGGSTLTHTVNGETRVVGLPDEPIGREYDRQLDGLPALLADPASPGRAVRDARWTIDVTERIYASAALGHGRPPRSGTSGEVLAR